MEKAELVTGVYGETGRYRAIIKPEISKRVHIWMYIATDKIEAIAFAMEIAKKLDIQYVGEFDYNHSTGELTKKQ